jgi:lipopolysaccharide biosynthesis glycosyltransferase
MSVPFVVMADSIRTSMRSVPRKVVVHAIHTEALRPDVLAIARSNTPLFEVRFLALDSALSQFTVSRHVTHATYVRFQLPDLLPDVERLLYLDVDLLVLRRIDELFDSDLSGAPLGACNDFALTIYAAQTGLQIDPTNGVTSSGGIEVASYLGDTVGLAAGCERRYFNAGVLLIDLKLWREQAVAKRAVEAALAHPEFVFHDQDALNSVLWADYQELDHKWNANASCSNPAYLEKSGATELAICWDWATNPYIVHFSGSSKPWNPRSYTTDHDRLFWRFARRAGIHKAALDLMPVDLRGTAMNSDRRSRFLARCRHWLKL